MTDLTQRLATLEHQLRWQRRILGVLGLAVAGGLLAAAASGPPALIETQAIRIVDAAGRPRILIGAPAPSDGRVRKDAQTAALVVLGPDGRDRLILGENPDPVVNGKTVKRIAPAYGLILHNKEGQERGGMANLDNGRSIVALDRANADAVALIVNEESGFAGLTVNYAAAQGVYTEGVRIGTKGDEAWLALNDRKDERARLSTTGPAAPRLLTRPAGAAAKP